MILRMLQAQPSRVMAVAMTLIVVGLSILLLGVAWPRLSTLTPHLGVRWNDFFRGLLIGVGIGIEIMGLVFAASTAVTKRNRSR